MKNYISIVTFLTVVLVCLNSNKVLSQTRSIIGVIQHNVNIKKVQISKYNNPYSLERIATVDIIDSTFYFSKYLREADLYIVTNLENNTFFKFIWDGNISLKLGGNDFSRSVVENSPMSDEYNRYSEELYTKYMTPIKNIEGKIEKLKTQNFVGKQTIMDSLKTVHAKLYEEGIEGYKTFRREYVETHRSSLISLFLITQGGGEKPSEEFVQLYNLLSTDLKKHNRANIYK
ncbi:hypothetical protein GCM10027578_05560 [Spirosoma luteolum]